MIKTSRCLPLTVELKNLLGSKVENIIVDFPHKAMDTIEVGDLKLVVSAESSGLYMVVSESKNKTPRKMSVATTKGAEDTPFLSPVKYLETIGILCSL